MNLYKRYIANKNKHKTPECVTDALHHAECVMRDYSPEDLKKYRATFDKKIERIINEDIEVLEVQLASLKTLQNYECPI